MSNVTWQRRSGVMLCYPFEEKRLARWNPPYLVQPKLDGWRCRAVRVQGTYLLLSSEENVIVSVPFVNESVDKLLSSNELDGELYVHGWSFEEIDSVCSRTRNLHPDHDKMEYHVYDVVVGGPQHVRSRAIPELNLKPPLFQVPTFPCWTLDEVKKAYDRLVSMGYEGIVIRHIDNNYVRRRTPMMMKFKPKKKDTYLIVDWKEEISKDGAPKARIGSLIMSSQEGDIFGVGAGLNDDEKEDLWNRREELPGMTAIVHYQHLTSKGIPKGTFDVEVMDKPVEGRRI